MDSSSLQVDNDGSFEILLAPQRPENYSGNFISTLKVVEQAHPADASMPPQRYADYISGRQLFNDWEYEQAIHLEIVQEDARGSHAPDYGVGQAARELRRCGELVRNQMHFWNAFWTILMGTYGEREGSIPGVAFPRNAFNKVNAASGATGGGMSTNLYAGGVFELARDEALIVEITIPRAPQYMGFQVGNLWGESIEYGHQIGSLNSHQMTTDDDGIVRIVLAHEDPGVHNWVDTTGHPQGFMTARWAYSETPDTTDWPLLSAHKVSFADIGKRLPATTPTVSPAQRRQQIAVRAQHVQKRYRVF